MVSRDAGLYYLRVFVCKKIPCAQERWYQQISVLFDCGGQNWMLVSQFARSENHEILTIFEFISEFSNIYYFIIPWAICYIQLSTHTQLIQLIISHRSIAVSVIFNCLRVVRNLPIHTLSHHKHKGLCIVSTNINLEMVCILKIMI